MVRKVFGGKKIEDKKHLKLWKKCSMAQKKHRECHFLCGIFSNKERETGTLLRQIKKKPLKKERGKDLLLKLDFCGKHCCHKQVRFYLQISLFCKFKVENSMAIVHAIFEDFLDMYVNSQSDRQATKLA